MQLTLDLITPEESGVEPEEYRQQLRKFRNLAIATGTIFASDDMGELREACLIRGLNQACWRFLNHYDEGAYAVVIPFAVDDEDLFERALLYIKWQCSGGLQQPLPEELGSRFVSCMGEIDDPVSEIDPRIAKVANNHWSKLSDSAEREFFAREEWTRVLNWMRDEQPSFDRNQWRSGWGAIYRCYEKWQMLHPERIAWQSILPAFKQDGLHIRPLTSSLELAQEGSRMGNCVATYAKRCRSGNYRLFSISEEHSGRALATASLIKEDAYWKIDQIKGRFNRNPQARAAKLGRVILQKYVHQEELIARRNSLEHQQCAEQLRAEHEVYLSKRQIMPREIKAEFSREEVAFLEKASAWLGALASGELQPNACGQVRFIGVTRGIFQPKTESERIWIRLQQLCHAAKRAGVGRCA